MKRKQRIKLTESELKQIITESVRRILKENSEGITLEWESNNMGWRIPVDFKCNIYDNGYVESTCSLFDHKESITFSIDFPLYDENGNLNEEEIEDFVEEKWDDFFSQLEY